MKNCPHLVVLYVTDLPLYCWQPLICTAVTEVAMPCLVEYCETVRANHKLSGWKRKTMRFLSSLGSRVFLMPRNPLPVSSVFIHTVSCKCSGFVSSNYFRAFNCSSIIHVYVLNKKCLDLPGFGLVCKSNHDIYILLWHTFLVFF